MAVSTQIARIVNQVSDQKGLIEGICDSLLITPATTGGTQLEINKINLQYIFEAMQWEYPAVVGNTLIMTQAFGATQDGLTLEVE